MSRVDGLLVRSVSKFVGRDRELAAIRRFFADETRSLLTITALGGMGKTRLAIEYADTDEHTHAIISLLRARTEDDLAGAIAARLELTLDGTSSSFDQIRAHLSAQTKPLLVLDNAEGLDDRARVQLGELARRRVARVLVTAREPLGIDSEGILFLEPLDAEAAAALFVARASSAIRAVSAEPLDAALVAEIITELEGIPLAIELAAARSEILPLCAIKEGLRARFSFLRAPERSAIGRHDVLFDVLAGAWNALDAELRDALAALSVFTGDFDLEAARAVIDRPDTVDILHALARRSLLTRHGDRYFVLECLRELIAGFDDARAAAKRHAQFFIARATQLEAAADAAAIERDRANIIAALEHTPSFTALAALALVLPDRGGARVLFDWVEKLGPATGEDALIAARVRAIALRYLGSQAEAIAALAPFVARADLPESRRAAQLLATAARDRANAGRLREAAEVLARARELFARTGSRSDEASCLLDASYIDVGLGQLDEALPRLKSCIAMFAELGDRRREALALILLGVTESEQRNLDEAEASFLHALELFRACGTLSIQEGIARGYRAGLDHWRSKIDAAYAGYVAIADDFAAAGHLRLEAVYRAYAGIAALQLGRHEHAEALLQRAIADLDRFGDRKYRAIARAALVGAQAGTGDYERARRELAEIDLELAAIGNPNLARLTDVYRGVFAELDRACELAAALEGVASEDVQLAMPLLRSRIERTKTWRIARDGRRASSPHGRTIDVSHRSVLARLFSVLVRQRNDHPDRPLELAELISEVWPDEPRLARASGKQRLKVAIWSLRNLGLEELIVRRSGGYCLDPTVPILVEDAPVLKINAG